MGINDSKDHTDTDTILKRRKQNKRKTNNANVTILTPAKLRDETVFIYLLNFIFTLCISIVKNKKKTFEKGKYLK